VATVPGPDRQGTFEARLVHQGGGDTPGRSAARLGDRDEHVLGQAQSVGLEPGAAPGAEEHHVRPAVEADLVLGFQARKRGHLVPEQNAEAGKRGGKERDQVRLRDDA